ncbi:MAG TPA: DNA replication and repair protein RecF [Ignavibacteria bacterium]|nr:DNA replication and repair protein RecF [Ignavibacteria bacterium]
MILKKLHLNNFRNYKLLDTEFNRKFNFIYGDNGNGKTNILEAISFTSAAKSFIGSSETDCLKQNENSFILRAEFENDLSNTENCVIEFDKQIKKKNILVNGEKVNSVSSEFFGKFPLVYLTPHSLEISYGNPSERRKFFDILISQSSKLYLDDLKVLSKLLKQKNFLFKEFSIFKRYSFSEFSDLLEVYNQKISVISAGVIFKRLKFLKEFKSEFDNSYNFLISDSGTSVIEYYSELFSDSPEISKSDLTFEYLKDLLTVALDNMKDREIGKSVSLVGPQRDDFIFRIFKNNESFELKNHGSQGEHKTFIVALKLAEYEYLKNKNQSNPVLLLDDILSELDENRVSQIISHLKDYGQIFLTTTDKKYLEKIKKFYDKKDIGIYLVNDGILKNQN